MGLKTKEVLKLVPIVLQEVGFEGQTDKEEETEKVHILARDEERAMGDHLE
jgi:hypothetical protein